MYSNITRKYVKYPYRSFRVEVFETNKVIFFDDVDVNCGGLKGFCESVQVAFQLPPIKEVILTWYSDTSPFSLASNSDLFEMWENGVIEDGYVNLYINIRNSKVPLSHEFPSSSGVTDGKSYSTPVKNGIISWAIMVCKNENGDNCHLFLKALKPHIENHHAGKLCFISAHRKVLIPQWQLYFLSTTIAIVLDIYSKTSKHIL